MANNGPKIPAETWVALARSTLVESGIEAVKVDRLAKALGVTRGGFYHHFADRADLLDRLLRSWQTSVHFLPPGPQPKDPAQALQAINALGDHLIAEKEYDPGFDMALRAWAHADPKVAAAVEQSDTQRIHGLRHIFAALGCEPQEASIRARVFYFHQIGYYAIGVRESRAERLCQAATYIRILCGEENLEAARRWAAVRHAAA